MGTNDIGNVTMIVRLVTKFFVAVVVVVIFVVHSLNLTDLMGNESLSKCAVSVCGSYRNGFTTSISVALKEWGRWRKWTKKKIEEKIKRKFFSTFLWWELCVDQKSRIHSFVAQSTLDCEPLFGICHQIPISIFRSFLFLLDHSFIHTPHSISLTCICFKKKWNTSTYHFGCFFSIFFYLCVWIYFLFFFHFENDL